MIKDVKIGGATVGMGHPPFIVAEMSGNHDGSLKKALTIVEEVAKAGAHALKLQTYTPDTMTLDIHEDEFVINDRKSLWHGESLYELYKKAATPWDWHEPIFARCKELGIVCFSTPFDNTSLEFLESLDTPLYKIASFENIDIPLIRKVAATGKTLIISTGMAEISEIDEAVRASVSKERDNLVLLKCSSSYPATPLHSNLMTIPHMRDLFRCNVGLSDHTLDIGVSVASIALGASVIEKHVTLSRSAGGVDSSFSLEPCELKRLVSETKRAWESLGSVSYGPTEEDKGSIRFRRSIYIVKDMKFGEVFTEENIKAIRPGFGLPPKYMDVLPGRSIKRDARAGTPVSWDILN